MTSQSNGIAWIEQSYDGRDGYEFALHRSDGPAEPGARFPSDDEVLDRGPDIDPKSLRQVGDTIRWTDAGAERSAPLH